jgi:hypothetical protein
MYRIFRISLIIGIAALAFGAAAACGSDDEPSIDAFIREAEQVDIEHEAAAEPRRARLDAIASSLTPDQPVPSEAEQLFRELFEGEAAFADSIEALDAPKQYARLRMDAVAALRAESAYGIAMLSGLAADATVADLLAEMESEEALALQTRRTEACVSMQELAHERGIAADFTC